MAKKKREVKKRVTVIDPKIKEFADSFGVEFRLGSTPQSVDIVCENLPPKVMACYFGQGVIFVRDLTSVTKRENLNFMLCHELSHAIHDFFGLEGLKEKGHEDFANAGAFIIMAHLDLPVSKQMIKNVVTYTNGRKIQRGFKGTL